MASKKKIKNMSYIDTSNLFSSSDGEFFSLPKTQKNTIQQVVNNLVDDPDALVFDDI